MSSTQESPRKRPKIDLKTRWADARDLMLKADEDDNDGLPMLLSTYNGADSTHAPSTKSTKPGKTSISDTEIPIEPRMKPWKPPPCDPLLEVPGELVLAKERRGRSEYWPAKLLEYIQPTQSNQKPKYKAIFFDGKIKALEPDMFFTTESEGFKTCQLGEDKYNYGLDDDQDEPAGLIDMDSRGRILEVSSMDAAALRSASPPSVLSPLDFSIALPLATQFNYMKPVLAAAMDGEYTPVKDRHTAFMRGGTARQKVCESGYSYGPLQHAEVEELLDLVTSWAFRRARREELGIFVSHDNVNATVLSVGDAHAERADQPAAADEEMHDPLIPISQADTSDTELNGPSSQAEPPPSSFLAPDADAEDDIHPKPDAISSAVPEGRADIKGTCDTTALRTSGGSSPDEQLQFVKIAETDGNLDVRAEDEPSFDENQQRRSQLSFLHLSEVDKLTYCQNILLYVAALQLLLWRAGARTLMHLLSPEQEQRLHDLAITKADETYWVHDIIRLREVARNEMLPSTKRKKRNRIAPHAFSATMTTTRLRLRRR